MIPHVCIDPIPEGMFDNDSIRWASGHLNEQLAVRGIQTGTGSKAPSVRIRMLGSRSPEAVRIAHENGITLPEEAESFALIRERVNGADRITAVAAESRGMVYALLELADVVACSGHPISALRDVRTRAERPHNTVRSITRLFTSEPEDKPWFYSRSFWEEYLTELATQRFNRLTFSVGAGYDYLIDKIVLDNYFCFIYPFVLDVPGYDVRVDGLPDEERDRNLEMLRFIGQQCRLRGLEFRLGLWNHSFDYGPDNHVAHHAIKGLDPEHHAAYCRDALVALLKAIPEVTGLTFRVHFEGGVPEPTHVFWREVLSRIGEAENLQNIDFHSKGVTDELRAILEATGKDYVLSTKIWAEHMGPPYHQASIRDREFYGASKRGADSTAGGTGHHELDVKGTSITQKRSFTRYGYGDFLRDDRTYGMVHRVWPGTQRILQWGDPETAAATGRCAGFMNARGIEWFEPLSFKGKKGSGKEGCRELYQAENLKLGVRDWTKFRYSYRLLGRLSYDPDAQPDSWRRFLTSQYGAAASEMEQALGNASRVFSFLLLVHAPSVANNVYWPEMYTNIPLVRGSEGIENPYAREGWSANADFDMEAPYNFMNTSPLDPILVYKVNEFADDVLAGRRSGKMTPVEIADWLDATADRAGRHLNEALQLAEDIRIPAFVRSAADIRIMEGTARFFAWKFRAGLAFSLYEKSGGRLLLTEALNHYRKARTAWAEMVAAIEGVYRDDLTFGHPPYTRGHWADRLADIDEDIARMEKLAEVCTEDADTRTVASLLAPLTRGLRPVCLHTPPAEAVKGSAVGIAAEVPGLPSAGSVKLYYRPVDQSRLYKTALMERDGDTFRAVVPAEATRTPYALMYFFELCSGSGDAWMVPGYRENMTGQPYYVLATDPE